MRSSGFRTPAALGVLAVLAGTALAPPAAAAVIDPAPIGPRQTFVGEVNGTSKGATVQMGCFGPIVPGATGHPLAGQSVDVLPASLSTTADVGYTGSAGTQVNVSFGEAVSVSLPVVLRAYAVKAEIPTSLVLPCYGSGKVVFTPQPTSADARSSTVVVDYVGQP
ncbi:hypothetical protein [Peterkaempfera griseoplana]|uniref:hypothetical protein n=1 Tax=Peterkaempfera griseoplana TaxID=66896 RepID=UPI0006E14C09|nr:hypothetical protein [Peterkaempfera griseoplana]